MRDAETRRLKIEDGLALDVCGRELVQVGCTMLQLGDVLVVDHRGRRLDPTAAFKTAEAMQRLDAGERCCWLLEAHYAEQNADPVQITDACRCEHDEWDHACETVRYSLRRVPCEECCREPECELDCRCTHEGCCHSERDREAEPSYQEERLEELEGEARELMYRRRPVPPRMRGGCRCICDHLTGLNPGEDCTCRLCEIDEMCGSVRVDLGHGVPLACVEVVLNDCDEWTFGPKVEVCGPRRFVKRNDLLFDLIQGCDLTRISRIGWADWHRREHAVPHAEFLAALGYDGAEQDIYVARDFWVEFSRPVKRETVRADCFAMTVLSRDERERWWTPNRVPIIGVELWPSAPETPQLVRGARIVVDGVWLYDAVRSSASVFHDHVTRVEFEVRGDYIVDCNDQTVDAGANGLLVPPAANRLTRGTFISTFSVAKSEDSERRSHREYAARPQGAER
jgi:hypothetical protein